MIRRLFNFSAAVSLMLLVAIMAFSCRSYFGTDVIERIFGPTISGYDMYRQRIHLIHPTVSSYDIYRQSLCLIHSDGRSRLTYYPYRIVALANQPYVPTNWVYDRPQWKPDLTAAWFRRNCPTEASIASIHWDTKTGQGWNVLVPDYAAMLITALLPVTWAAMWVLKRSRRRIGLCQTCSYDLTGNISGICPECGARIPTMIVA